MPMKQVAGNNSTFFFLLKYDQDLFGLIANVSKE